MTIGESHKMQVEVSRGGAKGQGGEGVTYYMEESLS